MELSPKTRGEILRLLLAIAVIVTILGFIIDIVNTLQYGGIDLRNRVVGARALIEGMDPYFFKWHQGMSDRLLDPLVKPNSITSRVTVPPTVLLLHSTIAGLSYLQQKIIWLIVQWGAFLSTIVIFVYQSNSPLKRNLTLTLGFLGLNSLFWRVHVERGQIYIIYVFLLSLAWFFARSSFKYHDILSGFLVGLTVSLRPLVILIFIPLVIYRQWTLLWGGIIGLLANLSFSFTLAKLSTWQSYFSAMSGITKLIDFRQDQLAGSNTDETGTIYPQIIEGMSNLRSMINLPHASSSIRTILDFLEVNFNSSNVLIVSLFLLILLVSLWLNSLPHKNISINLVFLSGIVLYLISEFFIPVGRDSYNDVQWILPLSLIVAEADIPKLLTNRWTIILLFSLLLSIGGFVWIPRFLLVGIDLMALSIAFISLNLIEQGVKEDSLL